MIEKLESGYILSEGGKRTAFGSERDLSKNLIERFDIELTIALNKKHSLIAINSDVELNPVQAARQ